MYYLTYDALTKEIVRSGDKVRDFRGTESTFYYATRQASCGKSGKVVVDSYYGTEYYDSVFNLLVKGFEEYDYKKIFVETSLANLIKDMQYVRILKLEYIKLIESEIVYIYYLNGHLKKIDVSCNSLKAITLDVLKNI